MNTAGMLPCVTVRSLYLGLHSKIYYYSLGLAFTSHQLIPSPFVSDESTTPPPPPPTPSFPSNGIG